MRAQRGTDNGGGQPAKYKWVLLGLHSNLDEGIWKVKVGKA